MLGGGSLLFCRAREWSRVRCAGAAVARRAVARVMSRAEGRGRERLPADPARWFPANFPTVGGHRYYNKWR